MLITGNGKCKLIDPEIPVLVQSKVGTPVIDLATKGMRYVSEHKVNVSKIREFLSVHENSILYYPRPDTLPLLSEYNYLMDGYHQTKPLKTMTLDIEVGSYSASPYKPLDYPIISIGVKRDDKPSIAIHQYDRTRDDYYILKAFAEVMHDTDPDIMMCFNGHFDIPFILIRMMLFKQAIDFGRKFQGCGRQIPIADRSRDAFDLFRQFEGMNTKSIRDIIPGRVIYDIMLDAKADQSLSGKVKNRKLKTVSKYYGLDPKELDPSDYKDMRKLIGSERMIEYNKSDVDITYHLGKKVYLPVSNAISEMNNIPIGNCINPMPSYVSTIISMRALTAQNIFPFDSNKERYSRYSTLENMTDNDEILITDNPDEIEIIDPDDDDLIKAKIEAAIVYQSEKLAGYHEKVEKYDFTGYYPSTIITLNLGPDTTRMVGVRDIKPDDPLVNVEKTPGNLRLYVKDKNWNKIVIIDVDQTKDSFYKKMLLSLREMRKKIKAKMKIETNDGIKEALNAQQTAIKVIMNVFYGQCALKFSKYGDMPVAIAIVGFCRDLTTYVCDNILTYDHIIEIDTDGMYVNKKFDVDDINKRIAEYVESKFGTKSFLSIEHESFGRGYFLKKKIYIIEDPSKNNEIVIKGSSLKGSNRPPLFDKAIKHISHSLIQGNTDLYSLAMDTINFDKYKWPEDFVISQKFKREKDAYVKTNAIYKLIVQLESKIDIRPGDVIEYLQTQHGPIPVQFLTDAMRYNYSYYYNSYIKGILATFDLDTAMSGQGKLF